MVFGGAEAEVGATEAGSLTIPCTWSLAVFVDRGRAITRAGGDPEAGPEEGWVSSSVARSLELRQTDLLHVGGVKVSGTYP